MSAYRKFIDILSQAESGGVVVANVATVAKAVLRPGPPLATLATLAASDLENENLDVPAVISPVDAKDGTPAYSWHLAPVGGADEHREGTVAKVANVAKASEGMNSDAPAITGSATSSGNPAERQVGRLASALIAPLPWYRHLPSAALAEPPYDQPYAPRRGHTERTATIFQHFCVDCGAWGSFGYGVTGDRLGVWYCGKHRPVENLR